VRGSCAMSECRVGQNHIYTVYLYGIIGRGINKSTVIYGVCIQFYWQGNQQMYGHIRCVYIYIYGSGQLYK